MHIFIPITKRNGVVVKDPYPGVPSSKLLGCFKIDSACHPSDVDQMSTRNFWKLSGKK